MPAETAARTAGEAEAPGAADAPGAAAAGPGAPCRPLRADARRNRDRILDAAAEVFATQGLAVPVDEVARRAGVGVGTLYRHFPTKEALYEAIVLSRVERLSQRACCLAGADDPGAAFFSFLEDLAAEVATKRDLSDALASAGIDIKERADGRMEAFQAAVTTLLERAQGCGAVRADVSMTDVMGLVIGSCLSPVHGDGPAPDARRMLSIVCDGLRAPGQG